MTSSVGRRACLGSLVAGVATILGARASGAPALPLVLVTSLKTPLDDISLGDLRQLFLGETLRDAKGGKLVPLNHAPGAPEREAFDRRVLGMSPDEMARHWIDQKVRGLKGAPRNLSPAQMLARVVERFPGAVSYLQPDQLSAGLRALRIDGRAPSHPDYALGRSGR